MRVLLVSVKYQVPGCKSISSATRLSFYVRTRGFASPDYSGFARSENDFLKSLKLLNKITARATKNEHSTRNRFFLPNIMLR